jgi:hypothetical protein
MATNFAEAMQQGYAFGAQQRQERERRSKLEELAGLSSKVIGGDYDATNRAYAIDPQAARTYQSEGDRRREQLAGMARGWKNVPSEQRQAYYERFIAPAVSSMGFGDLGPYDESAVDGVATQILAAYGGGATGGAVQSTFVDAQGNRVAIMRDGSTSVLGQNAPSNQIIDTGNGFFGVNKGNLSASPVMVGGQPQNAPQPGVGPGTYQTPQGLIRVGDLTPEQQELMLADIQAGQGSDQYQLPRRDVSPQQFGGGQQLRSAQKAQAPSDLERRLLMADQMGATPEEKRRMVIGGDSGRDAQRISAKDATTARQKITQIQAARQQINSARQAFEKLKGSFSAGLGGQYLPTPEGQAFDRAIANLAPLITAVTRVPGVGAMSDYESRLQNAALPSRGTYEAVTAQQFQDLENLLNTVEGGYNDLLSGGQAAPTAADEETSVDDLLSLYR